MNIRLLLTIVSIGLLFTSWKSTGKFPKAKVIQMFARLANDPTADPYAFVKVSNVLRIVDTNLEKLIPAFSFYYLIIQNGHHWEYNNGIIQTVAAVSTIDNNDIRLLLPQNYAKSSVNFFNMFYDKTIKSKENLCRSISNLLLKTFTRGTFNCASEFKNLHQTVNSLDTSLTVATSWVDVCWDYGKGKRGEIFEKAINKTTIFSFKGDKLVAINCAEWKR